MGFCDRLDWPSEKLVLNDFQFPFPFTLSYVHIYIVFCIKPVAAGILPLLLEQIVQNPIKKVQVRHRFLQKNNNNIWTPKGQNQVSALQRCPYYRSRDVWFLAFLGPNELSIIERCLYYRGVRKERLDCTCTCILSACTVENFSTHFMCDYV